MFTCMMCKSEIEGDAALVNGVGSFCSTCKGIIFERMAEAHRVKAETLDGRCLWCGEDITPETAQSKKLDEHVCLSCCRHRDWLLRSIRLSDRPAKYVARTEERESPLREERATQAMHEKQSQPIQQYITKPSDQDRIARIEIALEKLMKELGAHAAWHS